MGTPQVWLIESWGCTKYSGIGRPFHSPSSWYPRLSSDSCHSSLCPSLPESRDLPQTNPASREGLFLWGQQEKKSRQTTWRLWVPLKPRLLVGWVFSYHSDPTHEENQIFLIPWAQDMGNIIPMFLIYRKSVQWLPTSTHRTKYIHSLTHSYTCQRTLA